MNALINLYAGVTAKISLYLTDITLLLARLLAASVFFQSGMTKWNGFLSFNPDKYDLFLYEFFCPDPVREGALLLCDANTLDYVEGSSIVSFIETLAVSAGVAEIIFPILLAFGLFTRVGAAALIGMTLFIQLAVFPSWDHWWNPAVWWFIVLLSVLSMGPGRLSLDKLFGLEKAR
ncbi:DoxX family protein [Aliiglaciecola sp. 3_MG-2023]|uniref:DoxX family protein n=1 Tax=Aliiglaciecola sp. 3_MG-2023 TaxID=3062644 RepID=UPI0026E2C5E2|nr:DoxX family protein [Aliiglaciecola sp. 3_MG-2023]MDO6691987.1 DoxX family protein [Aliiglaciecola sp. 3_MG-2023]